jgi:hypothetical protein
MVLWAMTGRSRGRKQRRTEVDPEVVRAWVERTRAAQGLPASIEGQVVIARLVAIFRLAREEQSRRKATLKPMNADRQCHHPD